MIGSETASLILQSGQWAVLIVAFWRSFDYRRRD